MASATYEARSRRCRPSGSRSMIRALAGPRHSLSTPTTTAASARPGAAVRPLRASRVAAPKPDAAIAAACPRVDRAILAPIRARAMDVARVAAVLLLLVGTGLFIKYITGNSLEFKEIQAVSKIQKILLSDSSTVWLNRNSTLRYAIGQRAKYRLLELHGEGYFEVFPNKKQPFRVSPQKQKQNCKKRC